MNKFYITTFSIAAAVFTAPYILKSSSSSSEFFNFFNKQEQTCDHAAHSSSKKKVASKASPLKAPKYTLVSSTGKDFSSESITLPYIANLFFTKCEGPCPLTMKQLKRIKSKVKSEINLPIVSITVDPINDTPQVLKEYAKKHSAESKDWIFLTGDLSKINQIIEKGFNIGAAETPQTHSTRLVYVNKEGLIEDYFFGTDSKDIDELIEKINKN